MHTAWLRNPGTVQHFSDSLKKSWLWRQAARTALCRQMGWRGKVFTKTTQWSYKPGLAYQGFKPASVRPAMSFTPASIGRRTAIAGTDSGWW